MKLEGARVAVTGATGFLGRYLVRVLRGYGAQVIAVVRSPDKASILQQPGVEIRYGDLDDRGSLTAAFDGANAVVSNAALIAFGRGHRDALIESNLAGTSNVLEAAADAGVRRATMVSTATVYVKHRRGPYKETDPIWSNDNQPGRMGDYALSKALAETEARAISDRRGIALSICRPQMIYGAFDTRFTKDFRRLLELPVGFCTPGLYLPGVYAGDLADAMCRMLARPESDGHAYNVTHDPGAHTVWDMMHAFRKAGGKVSRLVLPIPVPLRFEYDNEFAKTELGFSNRPLVDAFEDTLALERQH